MRCHQTLVCCALLVEMASLGCKSSNDTPPAPAVASSAQAMTVGSRTSNSGGSPSTAATSTSGEELTCTVYPRRCEAPCKTAHFSAMMGTCKAETDVFRRSILNKGDFGKCLVACGAEQGCVGPADAAGCACQMACYKTLSGAALENAKKAARCYKKAVAAACE